MQVRLAAFEFLADHRRTYGEVFPSKVLWNDFQYRGQRVRLKGIQGIFKPAILDLPISITTAPPQEGRPAPYDDGFTTDGSLLYRYRGIDPGHHENVGLRRLMELRRPLIYFHGVVKGEYFAAWPVYVVGDEPAHLRFRVAIDDAEFVSPGLVDPSLIGDEESAARRRYITVTTRARLHQSSFRARVLRAYRERCALCRLRHQQLLDAAHILPDSDPLGEPRVSNGLALCKLHHAAFDQDLIGVNPDCVVEVRREILEERDGPMLLHGLQGFHGKKIWTPDEAGWKPRRELLEERYRRYVEAGRA